MPKPKVLCLFDTSIFPHTMDPIRDLGRIVQAEPTAENLRREIADTDIYIATLHQRLTADLIASAPRLKCVLTCSTGLDHLDVKALEARGIELISLKYDRAFLDSVTATAELAWALLLAVVRKIPSGFEAARQGRWARDEFRGHQLSGKTLGVLGYGRLGTMVADYGKAFRMRVLACDVKDFSASGVTRVDMDTLLRESDVLSVHVHLTPENTGLIGRRQFDLMKPGAVLVNTSRGAIVDEAAMIAALESGRLGGAGVDVIDGEWSTDLVNHPVIRYARTHDNLVISPHVGGVTFESQEMAFAHSIRKLREWMVRQG